MGSAAHCLSFSIPQSLRLSISMIHRPQSPILRSSTKEQKGAVPHGTAPAVRQGSTHDQAGSDEPSGHYPLDHFTSQAPLAQPPLPQAVVGQQVVQHEVQQGTCLQIVFGTQRVQVT